MNSIRKFSSAILAALLLVGSSAAFSSITYRVPLPKQQTAAVGAQLQATPTPLDFGNQPVFGSKALVVTLANPGDADLTLATAISSDAHFTVTGQTCGPTLSVGASCNITVTFSPTVAGSVTGNLHIPTDTPAISADVGLSGVGITGSLALTPNSVDFAPAQQVGSTSPIQTLTLKNVGAAPVTGLHVGLASGADSFGASNNCGTDLQAGQTCAIFAQFQPSQAGTRTGTLAVTSDASNGTQYSTLSGQGEDQAASLTGASIAAVQVGKSGSASVVLKNLGSGALDVGTAVVTGTGFSVASTSCTTSLAVGQNCQYVVSYSPTAAGGMIGTLKVQTGAGEQSADINAVGSAPAVALSTPAFANTDVGQSTIATATLTNTGVDTVQVSSMTAGAVTGADFAFASSSCGTQLAAGANCTITVRFTPLTGTAKTGQLTVQTEAGTSVVQLSATGLSSEPSLASQSLSFGAVQVGQPSAAQSIVVTNAGNRTMSLALTTQGDFSSTTDCTGVAPGATCQVNVSFTPTVTGARTGTATLTPQVGQPVVVPLDGSGQAQSATFTAPVFTATEVGSNSTGSAVLRNTGVGPLTLVVPSSANVAGDDFTFVSTSCSTSVAVGGQCNVKVRYSPSVNTGSAGTITLDTGAGAQTVTLGAIGIQGIASISPSALDFGAVQAGATSTTKQVVVTNTGTSMLQLLAIGISQGTSEFAQSNNCATLAVGSSCTIDIAFTPGTTGVRQGVLSLVHNGVSSAADVSLAGSGQVPSGSLSSADMGTVNLGSQVTQPVVLSNTGIGPLSVTASSAQVTGQDFSFVSTNCPASLAVSQSCLVYVKFAPTVKGSHLGAVSITTGAGSLQGTMGGTGMQASMAADQTALNFGNAQIGVTVSSSTVTLTNTGNRALTSLALNAPSGFSVVSSTCSATLDVGSTCRFVVNFTPAAAQPYASSLSIVSAETATSVSLVGAGVAQSGSFSQAGGQLAFSNVTIGAQPALTTTLANNGSGALSLSAISSSAVTGTDFSFVSTTCSSSLAVGGTCAVTVRFTPSAEASRTGLLSVSTGAGALTLPLAGTGVKPVVSFIPQSTNWGTVGIASDSGDWFTLRNDSDVTVLITGHTLLSGPAGMWSWQGASGYCQPGTTALAPGASCKSFFGIADLQAQQSFTAVDQITYRAQTQPATYALSQAYTFSLATTTFYNNPYSLLDFGMVAPFESRTFSVQVLNYASNGGPLFFSGYVETKPNYFGPTLNYYTVTNNCNSQVPPGGVCTVTVQFLFPKWDTFTNYDGTLHIVGGYARMSGGVVAPENYIPRNDSVHLTLDTHAYVYYDSGNDGGDDE
jgi:hypothetical protein